MGNAAMRRALLPPAPASPLPPCKRARWPRDHRRIEHDDPITAHAFQRSMTAPLAPAFAQMGGRAGKTDAPSARTVADAPLRHSQNRLQRMLLESHANHT